MLPPEQIGSVPQAQAMAGNGPPNLSPDDISFFRQDPEIVQAVSQFVGHPIDMKEVPDNLLVQVAGMVHKLGVQGAIQMAQRVIPPQVQQKIKQSIPPAQPQPNAQPNVKIPGAVSAVRG